MIVVGTESAREAVQRLCGCQQCSETASTSLEYVLDDIRKGEGAAAYMLADTLGCPNCHAPIVETTLVQLRESRQSNWFELPLPETEVVLVEESSLVEAQRLIAECESCGEDAQITFDYLLDAVTGCDPTKTEYLMCRPAKCPRCFREVNEKTLVIPE